MTAGPEPAYVSRQVTGDRDWHTAQVRAWMLAHPDVVARVRLQDSWRLYPLALQVAARSAPEQLPGVDFQLVDWEAAVGQVDPERPASLTAHRA